MRKRAGSRFFAPAVPASAKNHPSRGIPGMSRHARGERHRFNRAAHSTGIAASPDRASPGIFVPARRQEASNRLLDRPHRAGPGEGVGSGVERNGQGLAIMRPHNVLRCRNRRHEPTLRHFLRLEVTVLEYFIVYFYCERGGGRVKGKRRRVVVVYPIDPFGMELWALCH